MKDKDKTKEQLLEEITVLRQINKVQSNLVDDLKIGFFTLDKEWRFTFINDSAERYFVGYTKDNLIGRNIWETFPEITKTHLFTNYHEARSEQKPVHFRINSLYTNTWHTIHAYPSIEGLSIYFEDVTQNKNIKEALDANPAACSMLGYTKAELLQKNIKEISLPTDDLNHFQMLKNSGEITQEKHLVKKDGTIIPVELKAIALNEDLFIAYAREITEHKKAEETIQEMKIKIHEIINSITDGFYTLDKNLCFTFANEKTIMIFNKTTLGLIGKKLTDVIPNSIARNIKSYYLKALQDKEPVKFEVQGPNGSCYQTNIYPIEDGLSVFFQDITEKKLLQQEFLRLDRLHLVGQMSAGIGHEIRNPMTTVRGFLQMLGVSEADPKKREYFEVMIEELDRANSIITEFLSLAKDKVVTMRPASLNVILNTLYPLLTADAIRQDKRVVLNKGDIVNIPLNEKEVRQLVFNLVRNGLEAMSPGGVLSIGTYTMNDEVVLYVEDEGPGIQPEILEKLGNPFVTTKDTGTGLGLAVCYSIAHRHNAKIDVKTASTGTTFLIRFSLPKKRVSDEQVS